MKKWIFLLVMLPLAFAQANGFNDEDLSILLEKQQAGIIYVWSPFMPLSIIGREEIIDISHNLGVPAKLLVGYPEGQNISDDEVTSESLLTMGVFDHFPALLVYVNGKLLKTIIHGYEAPESLEFMIKKLLEDEHL